jgi:Protein of unknown function (DUF2867)
LIAGVALEPAPPATLRHGVPAAGVLLWAQERRDAPSMLIRNPAAMTQVRAAKPASGIGEILAGAHFIDAYRVVVADDRLDALQATRMALGHQPGWVDALLALRNGIVAPLGLKTSGRDAEPALETIGIMPIQSVTPSRVVLGFADRHLDFRVVMDVARADGGSAVTATTLVRLNNLFGRLYLAAITPFHRVIVRTMLKRMATRLGALRAAAR